MIATMQKTKSQINTLEKLGEKNRSDINIDHGRRDKNDLQKQTTI